MGTLQQICIMLRRLSVSEVAGTVVAVIAAAAVLAEIWRALHGG